MRALLRLAGADGKAIFNKVFSTIIEDATSEARK